MTYAQLLERTVDDREETPRLGRFSERKYRRMNRWKIAASRLIIYAAQSGGSVHEERANRLATERAINLLHAIAFAGGF